jgi:hypothetical protein
MIQSEVDSAGAFWWPPDDCDGGSSPTTTPAGQKIPPGFYSGRGLVTHVLTDRTTLSCIYSPDRPIYLNTRVAGLLVRPVGNRGRTAAWMHGLRASSVSARGHGRPHTGDKGAPGATGTSYSNLQARDLTEPPARHTTGAQ